MKYKSEKLEEAPAPRARTSFTLSIRAKLFGLLLSLLLILAFSGYVLQNTLSGSLLIIEKQGVTIEALQATTKAEKTYTNLRWSFLNFLGNPSQDNFQMVRKGLTTFREGLSPLTFPELKTPLAIVYSYIDNLEVMTEKFRKAKPDSARAKAMEADATRKLGEIDEILNDTANTLENMLTAHASATMQETKSLHNIPTIFMLGGLLTLMFASVVTIMQLFVPLSRLTRAMTAASIDTGNARDYVLPIFRADEIGRATGALNSLLLEVSHGIDRISRAESQLRETGQYLQAVMDNVADGIVTMSQSGTIETFSPSAEKLFGMKAQDVLGTPINRLLFDMRGVPFDPVAAGPSGTPALAQTELAARTIGGTIVPVEVAIARAAFAGRFLYIATLRDIATRKQMESFIERAQRMETVGRMTGGIAHDFNNMLTVISGNFELIDLKMKESDPLLKAMIKMGMETVRKGKDMTQRLLAISSKQLLKPEVLDLKDRVPIILEMAKRAVTEDIELNADIPRNIWNIRVDPVQFESAILNLAINARDALPGHGGQITMQMTNISLDAEPANAMGDAKPGEYVVASVIDNGSGIPKNILDRVFEPFFTTKDGNKGTGLGLSMVYGFTVQSGGFITIDSAEGQGTSVNLYFPRSEEKVLAQPANTVEEEDDGIPLGTESLLVVEDEPNVLVYLTQTLRELGYEVTEAQDAQSALKVIENGVTPDILVTDVVMPGKMNGEMLAQEAVRRLPDLKVLYISGYTRDALVEQGSLKEGVNLLAKPFTRADLASNIRAVLDRR